MISPKTHLANFTIGEFIQLSSKTVNIFKADIDCWISSNLANRLLQFAENTLTDPNILSELRFNIIIIIVALLLRRFQVSCFFLFSIQKLSVLKISCFIFIGILEKQYLVLHSMVIQQDRISRTNFYFYIAFQYEMGI